MYPCPRGMAGQILSTKQCYFYTYHSFEPSEVNIIKNNCWQVLITFDNYWHWFWHGLLMKRNVWFVVLYPCSSYFPGTWISFHATFQVPGHFKIPWISWISSASGPPTGYLLNILLFKFGSFISRNNFLLLFTLFTLCMWHIM